MTIKPLRGQVLVQLDRPQRFADLGELLLLPQRTIGPEEHQEAARNPIKPSGLVGIVKAIGPWPKTRSGMAKMPEFGVGAKVVVNPHRGLEMKYLGRQMKMIAQDDILAVINNT